MNLPKSNIQVIKQNTIVEPQDLSGFDKCSAFFQYLVDLLGGTVTSQ